MGPYLDCSGFTYATTSTGTYPIGIESLNISSTDFWKIGSGISNKEATNGGFKVKTEEIRKKFLPVMYAPKKIIYNGPATIVFWEDGTKTIVKKAKGEKNNRYNAFCAALAKKLYGNNSVVNRLVKSGKEEK